MYHMPATFIVESSIHRSSTEVVFVLWLHSIVSQYKSCSRTDAHHNSSCPPITPLHPVTAVHHPPWRISSGSQLPASPPLPHSPQCPPHPTTPLSHRNSASTRPPSEVPLPPPTQPPLTNQPRHDRLPPPIPQHNRRLHSTKPQRAPRPRPPRLRPGLDLLAQPRPANPLDPRAHMHRLPAARALPRLGSALRRAGLLRGGSYFAGRGRSGVCAAAD